MFCDSRLAILPILAVVLCCGAAPAFAKWENSLKPAGEAAGPLTLARAGTTEYVIVTAAAPTTMEQKAAEDLALWLGEMTGARFPIVSDSSEPIETEVSIGRTNRLADARIPGKGADLGNEGYAIGVDGQRLFLLGGKTRGVINAVYAFLEEDLGCRWYAGDASRIPHRRNLRVSPVPRTFVPPLFLRDPFYFDAFNATWSLRNRTNAPNAGVPEEWGGHVDYGGFFVHTYNTLVPPGTYFEAHPEYFMMSEGKRTPRQLCETNPEVARIASECILTALAAQPETEIVEVSPNDGGGHCTCPDCQAVNDENGSPSGSLLTLVNRVAEAVEKEHPGVLVSTLAYLDTVDAPKKIRPRDNVIIRLCNDLHSWRYPFTCFATDTKPESKRYRDAIIGWSKVAEHLSIWDYFVNFSHYSAPMPNMDVLQPTVDFYVAHKVKGIMFQGAYQGPGAEFAPLRCWVMAKLLWDPSLKVEPLENDFIWGYYENAAPDIFAYWELLKATKAANMDTMAAPPGGIRYDMTDPFLSKEFLAEATTIFDKALARNLRPEVQRRVELAKLPITYVKLMQGADATGEEYPSLINEFETIARREKIDFLREGGPDLDEKIRQWRDSLRIGQELGKIGNDEFEARALSPEWRFAPDPQDVGLKDGWQQPAFDDSQWAVVRSDTGNGWEHQGFADYTGFGWYRQRVDIPADLARSRAYLYFGAVDEDAYVYVNGQPAFEHTCASTGLSPEVIWTTPFAFDARPFVQPGQPNTLAVRVLNRGGMGGVYRPVHMLATDHELDGVLIAALLQRAEG